MGAYLSQGGGGVLPTSATFAGGGGGNPLPHVGVPSFTELQTNSKHYLPTHSRVLAATSFIEQFASFGRYAPW